MFTQETRADHAEPLVHYAGCTMLQYAVIDQWITDCSLTPMPEFGFVI
nr:hypothetical protein [Nitrosomonas supralitoralis]